MADTVSLEFRTEKHLQLLEKLVGFYRVGLPRDLMAKLRKGSLELHDTTRLSGICRIDNSKDDESEEEKDEEALGDCAETGADAPRSLARSSRTRAPPKETYVIEEATEPKPKRKKSALSLGADPVGVRFTYCAHFKDLAIRACFAVVSVRHLKKIGLLPK